MGSLGDLRFTPLSDRLPIEVFISIIEHEASDRNLTDLETVRMAMRHLDTKAISSSHLKTGKGELSWLELKARLIENFSHRGEFGAEQKLALISSLSKSPTEDCHHFLIRVQHAVMKVKDQEDWTEVLFLLGLSHEERSMFDPANLPNLYQICNTVNALLTDSLKTEEEEVVGAKSGNFVKQSPPLIEDDTVKAKSEEENSDSDDYNPEVAEFLGGESDGENIPLAKNKKALKKEALKPDASCKRSRQSNNVSKIVSDDIKTVTCAICSIEVKSKTYKRHLKEVHGGMEHRCEECGELLPSVPKLNHHMKKFHGDGYKKLLERAEKGEIFIDKSPEQTQPIKSLEPIVIRPTNPNEKLRTKCNLCPGEPEFEGAATFVQHYKSVHNGTRFGCDQCSYLANDLKRVHDHRLVIHNLAWGNKPIYYCKIDQCKFKTIDYYVFIDHLEVRHDTIEKTWVCSICDKRYATKSRLKTHTNVVHLNMKKHHCNQCDYSTTGAKQLQLHMDIHRDATQKTSRVLCVECGGVYNCQGSLNQHIKRIHRREKPHECPECPGKFFFTRVQLKKHQEDIHLERTHFCSHCNKAFARESRLKKHIEIAHLQIKKFRCKLCNQFFSESSNLCYHIGRKHMNFTDEEAKMNRNQAREHEAFQRLEGEQLPVGQKEVQV